MNVNDPICCICLDKIYENDDICRPCSYSELHCFHTRCIVQCRVFNSLCPLCKSKLKNETNGVDDHPSNHYFWKSFTITPEEESSILQQLSENNFTLFDEMRSKNRVPSSRFNYSTYFSGSIFKQLLDKNEENGMMSRLKSLSKDISYYPHDLDIVLSCKKGLFKIAKNLINNPRYNYKFSDQYLLHFELSNYHDIFQYYKRKF
jgi:hypothetical protein